MTSRQVQKAISHVDRARHYLNLAMIEVPVTERSGQVSESLNAGRRELAAFEQHLIAKQKPSRVGKE